MTRIMTRITTRTVLVAVGLFVALASVVWWTNLRSGGGDRTSDSFVSEYEEDFAASLPEFIAMRPPKAEEQGPNPEPDTPLRPKVVAIDLANQRLDRVHDLLPDTIRATSPDDVGTVLLIDCNSNRTEEIGPLNVSYRTHCTAFFINRRDGKLIATRYASKSPPIEDGMPIPFLDIVAERPIEALLKHVMVKFDLL